MLHTPASPYASSSVATRYGVKSAPPPAHSAGTHTPKSPRAPARRTLSSGTVAVRSHSAANGAISLRTKSRVMPRMDRCSSLRRLMAPEHSTGAVLPAAPHGPPHRRRRRRRVLARDHAGRRARRGGHRARPRRPPLRRAHRRDGGGLARRRARRRHGGRRAARLQPPRRQPVGHDPDRHGYGPGAQRRARALVRRRHRRRRQLRHAVRDRARAQARRARGRAFHLAARATGGAPRAADPRALRRRGRPPRGERRATARRPHGAHLAVVRGVAPIHVAAAVRRYGAVAALRGVSLDFPAGRLTAVLGPSGCGKTTLLRAIAGFLTLDEGRVRFGDDDVTALPPQQRGTAMVFQSYALWPHMTVFDNIAYGLRLKRVPKPEIAKRVEAALALVEIGDIDAVARRKPAALSGGQQQRVALARALVVEPRVLLLDEPLSNLDAKVRQRLRVEIRRLQRRVGITTVYVTHDQEEALAIADRVVLMSAGRVVQAGTPPEGYPAPATQFAAGFLGVGTRPHGRREARVPVLDETRQRPPHPRDEPRPGVGVLRASDVALGDAGPTLDGDLAESLFLGDRWRHYVRIGGAGVLVGAGAPPPPGPVRVSAAPARLRVYPRQGGSSC